MRRHIWPLLAILITSLIFFRSLFHSGFMYSHDSLWHVERLQNMASELPHQFPVRWSSDLDHNYGVPLFNFIYPAPYYLGALIMTIGFGPLQSYNLLLFAGAFAGAIGIYLLGKKKPIFGFFAALFYLLTPYLYLDIFVRGALGEVIALGMVPWVFLALSRLESTGKISWYTSLPFAVLVLSHNFYGYLFGALFALLTIVLYKHKAIIFASLALSLGIAGFFLIPAFFEKSFLLYTQVDNLSYQDHFVFPIQLVKGVWNYLGSLPGLDPREMSFQLGITTWTLLLVSLVGIFRTKTRSSQFVWYSLILYGSVFMMLSWSDLLWRIIPLMSLIQFPWRFLGVVTIFSPMLYLEIAKQMVKSGNSKILLAFSVVVASVAIYLVKDFGLPEKWLNPQEFLALHYEYVGQTATSKRTEIVPRSAPIERYQPESGDIVKVIGDGVVRDVTSTGLSIKFTASSPNDHSQVVVARNYFPMWQAEASSQTLDLSPSPTGEIILNLLPGEHEYHLVVTSTQAQIIGNLVTVFSLLLVLFSVYKQGSVRLLSRPRQSQKV